MNFDTLLNLYRQTLLDDVMPFWMQHGIDPDGGLNTCMQDDGTLVSRDKWLWSQWRAVWVFSKLYNRIEARQEWLDVATHVYDFVRRHGWDDEVGGWVLRLDHTGKVLDGCDSIYADAFAIYALTEYCIATGDEEALALLKQSASHALRRLRETRPDEIPHFPYPIPAGAKVHGVPMMFSLVFWELGQFLDDDTYRQAAIAYSDEIFADFYDPKRGLLVERVKLDGSAFPAPLGTAVVPGHVIEDMWFQIHILRDRGDAAGIARACQVMRRHTEAGWDETFGGLFLAIDADGGEEIGWKFPETKLWWPHTEALYGLLLAYEQCGESWCLDWYTKIHDYSFSHYPHPEYGEWTQKLNRDGSPLTGTVALPVKDPFHLPRTLILCIDVLERLIANKGG